MIMRMYIYRSVQKSTIYMIELICLHVVLQQQE